ncbi:MAG: large-conductance mechanosensitive channel protein MscL [Ignavibacteria bacterium]|nr:large-conductance mechanosensitive channel protein MscL [Ignavibacteria bacterium]
MIEEFKKFIAQGNALDLAVGVIIGGAFGKIVSSFVGDIFMPVLGLMLGGIDFNSLGIVLKEGKDGAAPVIFAYGKFLQSVVDFFLIAIALFFLVKAINSFRTKKEEAPAPPPEDIVLLTEIRDLLKSK